MFYFCTLPIFLFLILYKFYFTLITTLLVGSCHSEQSEESGILRQILRFAQNDKTNY